MSIDKETKKETVVEGKTEPKGKKESVFKTTVEKVTKSVMKKDDKPKDSKPQKPVQEKAPKPVKEKPQKPVKEKPQKPTKEEKKAIEDARFVLPNACETKIVVTMNARSLLNFFRHRCCNRAQWEIRDVADQMLKLVCEVAPNLFKKAGASCVSGPCPEGKMTCGKMPQMREYFEKLKGQVK